MCKTIKVNGKTLVLKKGSTPFAVNGSYYDRCEYNGINRFCYRTPANYVWRETLASKISRFIKRNLNE